MLRSVWRDVVNMLPVVKLNINIEYMYTELTIHRYLHSYDLRVETAALGSKDLRTLRNLDVKNLP